MKFSIESVKALQSKVLANILTSPPVSSEVRIAGIIACLLAEPDVELVCWGLGGAGADLYDFARAIDCEHPCLQSLLNGALIRPTLVSKRFAQYISLAKFAKEQEWNEILSDIHKMAVKHIDKNLRGITKPFSQYVRLLSSPENREEIRKLKEVKLFDVGFLNKKANFNWEGISSDFALYCRNSMGYQEEIERAKKKALRYKELSCTAMYKEIITSINEFKNEFENDYYGFHQVTVSKVACILAKMHNVNCSQSPFRLTWQEEGRTYAYSPRIYPFHKFKTYMNFFMPSSIVKIVEHLDAFPPANRKPIFDHFLVVVPSIDTHTIEKNMENIQTHEICPALLGEADGKCYFICHII